MKSFRARQSGLILAAFAVPVLFCAHASAQPPRGPRPWWDGEVAKDLNLTDAQTKQIAQTRKDFRQRMFDVRSEVDKAESAVQAAFNQDPVDQVKANEAINQLAAARGEMTKAVSQMDLKLRMTLTADQWQQLQQKQRWPDRPGQHRRSSPPATSTPTTTPQK
jgi:Spy/CpxP family protein refolding chaperone